MARMKHALTIPVLLAYCTAEVSRREEKDEECGDTVGSVFEEVGSLFTEHGGADEGTEGDRILESFAKTARADYAAALAAGKGTGGRPGKKTLASTEAGIDYVLGKQGHDRSWFASAPEKDRAKVVAEGRVIGKVMFSDLNTKKA